MAIKKSTKASAKKAGKAARSSRNVNKASPKNTKKASRSLRKAAKPSARKPTKAMMRAFFERRLDLMLHFEPIFEQILKDREHCLPAEIAEALAKETVSWIEGFDDMLSIDELPRSQRGAAMDRVAAMNRALSVP